MALVHRGIRTKFFTAAKRRVSRRSGTQPTTRLGSEWLFTGKREPGNDDQDEKKKTSKSSGNVCADLGFPEPEVELAKAALAHAISSDIEENGWTQAAAAQRMGIDQPKISAIIRGRLEGFSLERLIRLLNSLDYVVDMTVRPAEHDSPAGEAVA